MRKRKTKSQKEKTAAFYYGLGALALALLIGAAFLAPRLVFKVQDNERCGEVVLGELESMDITSFNTGYDTNLYSRLYRFAKGLEKGQQYYTAAQELTPDSEIIDFFYSEKGLYQDSFLIWLYEDFMPDETLSYSPAEWKQYVIYGDDFSDGVNFILWYIELENDMGAPVLRLLMDAETGSIYGISTVMEDESLPQGKLLEDAMLTLEAMFGITDEEDMQDMWYAMAYYYGGQGSSELFRIIHEYGSLYLAGTETEFYSVDGYTEYPYNAGVGGNTAYEGEEELLKVFEMVNWEISENGNCIDFLLPYSRDGSLNETSELCFRLKADKVLVAKANYGGIDFYAKNFIVGFPEIYERIPEFME